MKHHGNTKYLDRVVLKLDNATEETCLEIMNRFGLYVLNGISEASRNFLCFGNYFSNIIYCNRKRESKSPLIDFKILLNRSILPAYIMILIVGLSLFLVFQTIPILVRNPPPVGFGGDPITTTRVQLPFVLILLIWTYFRFHNIKSWNCKVSNTGSCN